MWRAAAILVLALAGATVTSCGESETRPDAASAGPFVGEASRKGVFVAIVPGKKNVAAYVCNGGRGIAEAFSGRPEGGRAELRSPKGARLSVTYGADGSSGRVTLTGGRTLTFEAEPAKGRAGLYVVPRGRPVKTSWVVLNDGRQRGGIAAARVSPAAGFGTVPQAGRVNVVRVTSREVSTAGFNGGGGFGGGFGG